MTFVSASGSGGNGTSINCSIPSGLQIGDVLLAFHSNDVGTYAGMTTNAQLTFFGGFDGTSTGMRSRCYSRVIDGTEPVSYVFNNSTTGACVAQMAAFRSVTLTGNTSSFTSTAAGDNQWTCPSLSPATGNGDLICFVGYGTDNAANTFTPPAGMDERADTQGSTWVSSTIATLSNPGTPTQARTFTSTLTANWTVPANGAAFSIYLPYNLLVDPQTAGSHHSSAMAEMEAYI